MKLLLLGKNGQVGWELQRALAPLGEVTAYDRRVADLTRPEDLSDILQSVKPDVIVNAAAYTAVDKAEQESTLARTINAEAPATLARIAAKSGALLVHYSTDYVFNGMGNRPWDEEDITGPLSVYGKTKLAGEEEILASGCRYLILRTSWVYGARGGNFIKTMLRLAQERDSLSVISDQIGAPTGSELIADVTAHAIVKISSEQSEPGLYHLASGGETSWYHYAKFVLEQASAAGVQLKVQPDAITEIPTSAYKTAAVRPLNSRLDTSRLQAALALNLPHWQSGVARTLTEILGK